MFVYVFKHTLSHDFLFTETFFEIFAIGAQWRPYMNPMHPMNPIEIVKMPKNSRKLAKNE